MSTDGQQKRRLLSFSSRTVAQRKGLWVAAMVVIVMVVGGGVWAFYHSQTLKDTSIEKNADNTNAAPVVEQTEANKVETTASELLADGNVEGTVAYYESLVQGTSDATRQSDYYLQLANSLFTAYPDAQQQAVRTAAYKAEELHPSATTADFIAVIEEYYGNKEVSAKYRGIYSDRLGSVGEVE